MSLSASIAPHLPYLRRFSRAVSGSQQSGDALVAAMLEAIVADVDLFPEASNARIALYKIYAKLFTSIAIRVPEVLKKSGDAYVNKRSGGLSAPKSGASLVTTAPEFTTPRFEPNPSIGIALPTAAEVTPGIAANAS